MVHAEVAESGMEALDHFKRFGHKEGRTGVPPDLGHISEYNVRDRYDFFHRAFQALYMNGISWHRRRSPRSVRRKEAPRGARVSRSAAVVSLVFPPSISAGCRPR